ncbi:MAG: hypothetical protein M1835_004360 [Candelina submexicana]|nr:MAG: hypothetical protein M1835_004360 [Candelina submexicana]
MIHSSPLLLIFFKDLLLKSSHNTADTLRNPLEKADEAALTKQEDGIQVAAQWAQEKIDTFLLEIEIPSYSISATSSLVEPPLKFFPRKRALSVNLWGTSSAILWLARLQEGLTGLVKGAIGKLLGSSSGSAKTDQVYEITFDELGGLNRLDAFIFSYCFTSSGLTDFTKAVIGVCIVRSAANMVDDNAYRVALTSSATIDDNSRKLINQHLIKVAEGQKTTLNEHGERMNIEDGVLAGEPGWPRLLVKMSPIRQSIWHAPERKVQEHYLTREAHKGTHKKPHQGAHKGAVKVPNH